MASITFHILTADRRMEAVTVKGADVNDIYRRFASARPLANVRYTMDNGPIVPLAVFG